MCRGGEEVLSSDSKTKPCTMKQDSSFIETKNTKWGTALVVILSYSEIFLGQLALRFDTWFKWLLWAVSNLVSNQFNLACSVTCIKCIVLYGRVWTEHYSTTLSIVSGVVQSLLFCELKQSKYTQQQVFEPYLLIIGDKSAQTLGYL